MAADLPHARAVERGGTLGKSGGDLVDGVPGGTKAEHRFSCSLFGRCHRRTGSAVEEEPTVAGTKVPGHGSHGRLGVAEAGARLSCGGPFDEVGAQRLIAPVSGPVRRHEERSVAPIGPYR